MSANSKIALEISNPHFWTNHVKRIISMFALTFGPYQKSLRSYMNPMIKKLHSYLDPLVMKFALIFEPYK